MTQPNLEAGKQPPKAETAGETTAATELAEKSQKVDDANLYIQAEFKKFQEANQKSGKKMDSAEDTFLLKMALKLDKVNAKANSKAYDALPVEQKRELDITINELRDMLQSQPEVKTAEAKKDSKEAAFTPLAKEQLATIVENDQLPSNATEKTKGIMDNLKAVGYKLGIKDEKLFVTRIVEAEGKPFIIEPISFKISADTDIDTALQKFLDEAKTKAKPAAQPETQAEAAPASNVESITKPAPAADTANPAEATPTPTSAEASPTPAVESAAKPAAETKEATPTGEVITKYTIGLSPEEIKMVEGIQSKGYEIRKEGRGDSAVAKLYIGNKIEGESHGEIKPALENFAYQVKDKPSVKSPASFSEIGDKIGSFFKGIFSKKEAKQPIEKQQVTPSGIENQPLATKTPAGRGFTLDDIQDPKSGNKQPKFNQQPNQQDSNVNVGRIQVEGREASVNPPPVKPKPNLGKVDISDIPTGEVIDPKTGKTI